MIKLILNLCTLCLCLLWTSDQCLAQKSATSKKSSEKLTTVVTKISPKQHKALVAYIKGKNESIPIVEFKVPSVAVVECIVGFEGEIECSPMSTNRQCPESIKVKLPGGQTAEMKVNCVGPDADGNCECESAN